MAFTDLFSGGAGKLIESVGGVIDRFVHTKGEKAEVMLEIERIAQAQMTEIETTLRTQITAKEKIMVAELQHGDGYTKRARPTVVYGGLGFLLLNNIILPWAAHYGGLTVPDIELPTEFWVGWSGIVATWSIGRTFEKRGVKSKIVDAVTGGGTSKLLD